MKTKIVLSMLSLLGFSSCSGNFFGGSVMYGCPSVDYRFMGEVKDAEGNPIKGINVDISSKKDAVVTDNNGEFEAETNNNYLSYHVVTFTDEDGVQNGGEFETKVVEVFTDTDSEEVDGEILFDLKSVTLELKDEQ